MLRESLGPGPAGPGAVAEARPQLISVDCTTGQTLFVPGLCRLVVNTASPEKMIHQHASGGDYVRLNRNGTWCG